MSQPSIIKLMLSFFFSLLIVSLFAGCAAQSDINYLDQRLSALERHNQEMSSEKKALQDKLEVIGKTREEEDLAIKSQSAGLNAEVDKLVEDVQRLDGETDEKVYALTNRLDALENQVKQSQGNQVYNGNRLLAIERYLNIEAPSTPAVASSSMTTGSPTTGTGPPMTPTVSDSPPLTETSPAPIEAPQKPLTEDQLYMSAKQAFDAGDYEKARMEFQGLIKQYPNSGRADNAQFWVGETYYRERWYQKAIVEYQTVIEKYSKGNKVASSLLKQAFSFFQLGDKANSRLILNELIRKYPNSNEAKVAKQKLTEMQ